MEIPRANFNMMFIVEVFCIIICKIFMAGMPLDIENALFDLVCDPEKTHFHRAGPLFFDSVVCDTCGGDVVTMYGRRRLWVAKFLEDEADNFAFFAIGE